MTWPVRILDHKRTQGAVRVAYLAHVRRYHRHEVLIYAATPDLPRPVRGQPRLRQEQDLGDLAGMGVR